MLSHPLAFIFSLFIRESDMHVYRHNSYLSVSNSRFFTYTSNLYSITAVNIALIEY